MSELSNRVQGLSFRSRAVTTLPEQELIEVRYRLAASLRDVTELQRQVASWRERSALTVEVRQDPDDRRVFEHILTSSNTFPHQKWSLLGGRAINEARSALDNFNMLMFERFAQASYDADRIYFPITTTGKEWRNWRQKHNALPAWAIDRYKQVQPSEGPFKGFVGLQRMDDDRKHKRPTPVSIAIVGQLSSGLMTFDGLVTEDDLAPSLVPISNVLGPGMRSVKIARIYFARDVFDFEVHTQMDGVDFDILFNFRDESYELPELVELPRRVSAAIDYISSGDAGALARYMAPPPWTTTPFAGFSDTLHHDLLSGRPSMKDVEKKIREAI